MNQNDLENNILIKIAGWVIGVPFVLAGMIVNLIGTILTAPIILLFGGRNKP